MSIVWDSLWCLLGLKVTVTFDKTRVSRSVVSLKRKCASDQVLCVWCLEFRTNFIHLFAELFVAYSMYPRTGVSKNFRNLSDSEKELTTESTYRLITEGISHSFN